MVVIQKFQPLVDAKREKYAKSYIIWKDMGTKDFRAKYPDVTDAEMKALEDFEHLTIAWEYFQREDSMQWLDAYCAEFTRIYEAEHPPEEEQA